MFILLSLHRLIGKVLGCSSCGNYMHWEQGWDVSGPAHHLIQEACERGSREFIETPYNSVIQLWEFYANVKVEHNNMKVRVGRRLVAFDSPTINGLYDMPNFDIDVYWSLCNTGWIVWKYLILFSTDGLYGNKRKGWTSVLLSTYLKFTPCRGFFSWLQESYNLVTTLMWSSTIKRWCTAF